MHTKWSTSDDSHVMLMQVTWYLAAHPGSPVRSHRVENFGEVEHFLEIVLRTESRRHRAAAMSTSFELVYYTQSGPEGDRPRSSNNQCGRTAPPLHLG